MQRLTSVGLVALAVNIHVRRRKIGAAAAVTEQHRAVLHKEEQACIAVTVQGMLIALLLASGVQKRAANQAKGRVIVFVVVQRAHGSIKFGVFARQINEVGAFRKWVRIGGIAE